MNKLLCEANEEGLFVTAWLGVIEISSGRLDYVNAGHNPPLVRTNGREYEDLRTKCNFVLADFEETKYCLCGLNLSKGGSLFLYTDGVTEATNERKELYGENRLKDILNKNKEKTSKELIEAIKKDVDDFVERKKIENNLLSYISTHPNIAIDYNIYSSPFKMLEEIEKLYSTVKISINPVTSKISMTVSFALITFILPCLFIIFCIARRTLNPADEIYSKFLKSKTRLVMPSRLLPTSFSSFGAVVVSNLPLTETQSLVPSNFFVISIFCILFKGFNLLL